LSYQLNSAVVNVSGLDVHYLVGGSGEPLIVIHGGTGGAKDWKNTMEALGKKYRVYIPDMPGFGLTGALIGKFHLDKLVDFLDEFVKALGLEKFRLMGHSYGGSIVLHYALSFPYKITRLVLVSSLSLGKEIAFWIRCTANEPFIRYIGRGLLSILKGVKRFLNAFVYSYDFVLPFSEASLMLGGTIANFHSQRNVLIDRLAELSMPTMVIWGDRDPVVPYHHAHDAAKLIKDCTVKIFSGSGHSVYREKHEEFNEALSRFLDMPDITVPDLELAAQK
jgi:pimeloyl-ACP methyl ester carboxylesterase